MICFAMNVAIKYFLYIIDEQVCNQLAAAPLYFNKTPKAHFSRKLAPFRQVYYPPWFRGLGNTCRLRISALTWRRRRMHRQ